MLRWWKSSYCYSGCDDWIYCYDGFRCGFRLIIIAGLYMAAVVLVIDDDKLLRELFCDILEGAGYVVESARSSSAGYDRLCAGGIDAVVCDVMLGDGLGPAMIERFNLAGHKIPVVYLSGYKWTTLVKKRILPIIAPFLRKPFNVDDLLSWVQTLTSKIED